MRSVLPFIKSSSREMGRVMTGSTRHADMLSSAFSFLPSFLPRFVAHQPVLLDRFHDLEPHSAHINSRQVPLRSSSPAWIETGEAGSLHQSTPGLPSFFPCFESYLGLTSSITRRLS
jgi:hypothetical protein